MTDTANKPALDANLYQEEEDYDQEIDREVSEGQQEYGYDENLDQNKEEQEEEKMDQREEQRLFQELLFCVQGVGSEKLINGFNVYYKHEHCEESLKDLLQNLRRDGQTYPYVKLTLGGWEFLQKHLVHLLVFHQQDKRLAFITTMLLVQLTEQPNERCTQDRQRYIENLRKYKKSFLNK